MTFVFFLFIVFVIGVIYVATRRRQVGNAFINAATRLGLRYSQEGTPGRQPWVYGERNGIRIDVRPFTRSQDGVRRKWTGYRLQYSEPIELSASGDNDAQRRITSRLTNRFTESEVDSKGLFCARSSLAEDSSRLVSDVEYLLNAARELRAATLEPPVAEPPPPAQPEPEEPDGPTPPPLPTRERPEVPETVSPQSEPLSEEELETPSICRQSTEAETLLSMETEEDSPVDLETLPGNDPEDLESSPPTDSPEELVEPSPPSPPKDSLEAAARDLFDEGRNHFEVGRHFETDYLRQTLKGSGWLRRVERFSNDRVFGRGPGLMAELEIHELENPSGGLQTIHAVVEFPPFEDEREARAVLAEWRERIGQSITVCGSPIKCDTFAGKLFLADGLVEAAAAA